MNFIAGEVIHFDKPLTWTSFDLVNKVRFALINHLGVKKLKVGHTGTLDPLATGLVTICTGKATKRIVKLQALEKEYIAELKLGETTPSFDLETEVDGTFPYAHITRELLDEKLQQFIGSIMQTPPAFSAVKIDGVRAYKLARRGKEIALKAKELVITSIEIVDFDLPKCTLKIVCSKGTYIRALARDIGKSLDSGAHLTGLRRTRVADVLVENSLSLEEFCAQYIKTDNK